MKFFFLNRNFQDPSKLSRNSRKHNLEIQEIKTKKILTSFELLGSVPVVPSQAPLILCPNNNLLGNILNGRKLK
jgi:hypothetical protein